MRRAELVPRGAQTASQIYAVLRKKGAPDFCHVTSSNEELDGSEMLLREALEQTVASGSGTIISCIPGKLAYFESEEPGDRYVLEHRTSIGNSSHLIRIFAVQNRQS